MTFPASEYENPFEPPRATIGGRVHAGDFGDIGDAELIRQAHIGHETNVKSLGHLNYLGAFFGVLITIIMIVLASGMIPLPPPKPGEADPAAMKPFFAMMAVVYLFLTVLNGALGYGLTHLQNWARWTSVVFTGIGLLYVAVMTVVFFLASPIVGALFLLFAGGINGFIMYLLVSTKAGVVFSREYKDVIKKTPHIKMKTSLIVKILLVFLIVVILFAVLAAIFGGVNNR